MQHTSQDSLIAQVRVILSQPPGEDAFHTLIILLTSNLAKEADSSVLANYVDVHLKDWTVAQRTLSISVLYERIYEQEKQRFPQAYVPYAQIEAKMIRALRHPLFLLVRGLDASFYPEIRQIIDSTWLKLPHIRNLHTIDLSGQQTNVNTLIKQLSKSPHLRSVKRLILQRCDLHDSNMQDWLDVSLLQQLEILDLSQNNFLPNTRKHLALKYPNLKVLWQGIPFPILRINTQSYEAGISAEDDRIMFRPQKFQYPLSHLFTLDWDASE